ncbi:MAG TPA: serine/threonine-protein kinase [Nocardioidaceae bacterium]|nr:serine/threonine-protein kinase [Nocardioidaceae bacterium]
MSTTASPDSGLWVGRYRLLTKIGEGGMGVVHLAQAPDGRRVAVKVLRPHVIGDDEARARLAREVASLGRVSSPRVAEILDADPWADLPFVATRYVPGLSLQQHLRAEGPLTGADLRHFATGLAEAVIAVHQVGVLHRDIKPSNVLLEGRSPVLIDFGLARLAEDPRLTHTGWLLGTPGYLAPEILYGEDATAASDVHSWAATVAFAATGTAPFGSGPAIAIMDRVRRGEHDLSGVPDDLRPLLTACLAPDPPDRPELAAVLSSLRIEPPRQWPQRRDRAMPTMPFALLAPDDDPTRVGGERTGTVRGSNGTSPLTAATAPTSQPFGDRPRLIPADVRRPPAAWSARLLRRLGLLSLFAAVVTGFAAAPYLCVLVVALAALGVRTFSWTGQSARERQYLRGRTRWYDAPLTVLSLPWYLLVAAGGTVVLLLSACAVVLVAGLAYALFAGPPLPGLLVCGGVLAVTAWWGPGSRRVRHPARRLATRAARRTWLGWTVVAVLAALLVVAGYSLTHGVWWWPAAGSPWRPGTMLGELGRWL